MVIASLYDIDMGPIPDDSNDFLVASFFHSYWHKKIISSTSNNMLVEFRADSFQKVLGIGGGVSDKRGFSTSIHYLPLPIKECKDGLNMTMKTIQSLNYPDSYDNSLSCKWLISVPYGSHITLKFLLFDVRFLVVSISNF